MNKYMEVAIKEAEKAYKKNEVPVGAVIVQDNKIIAKAHNNRQLKHNVLGHAEINCILKAEKKIKDWRLDNCVMYVTLEPCAMCWEIIKSCRLKNVKFLVSQNQERKKSCGDTNIYSTCEGNYIKLLKKFFKNMR